MTTTINLPAKLQALNEKVPQIFTAAFQNADVRTDDIVNEVPIAYPSFTLAALADLPMMRDWIGEKQVKNLTVISHTATAQDQELTIKIPRDAVVYDNLGLYSDHITLMGNQARKLKDQRVARIMLNGTAAGPQNQYVGFDGVPVFSAIHSFVEGGATQSNNNTGQALDATNFKESYDQMLSLVGAEGNTLGVVPTHLVVPPQLRSAAIDILKPEFLANGASNTNRELVQLIVLPELAPASTTWFLVSTHAGIKPFGHFVARQPEVISLTDPTSSNVFFNKEYLFSVEAKTETLCPLWFLVQRNVA